jgi:hypothetical protein
MEKRENREKQIDELVQTLAKESERASDLKVILMFVYIFNSFKNKLISLGSVQWQFL